jgi:nicotinamidase-related amidase
MMLRMEDAVLVVVDVQGKLATLMYEKEKFYKNVVRMIKGAQALDLPIIWTEQLPDKLGPTIDTIKDALPGAEPLVKNTFSCCGDQKFDDRLKETGRKQVLLTGMETHVCVYQTALDLLNDGYEVYLVADAVSSRDPENRQIGIAAIKDAGAKVTSVEMSLFEMLRVAEGGRFKQVIQIVK